MGPWRDDVTEMRKLVGQLEGRVPGLRWELPAHPGAEHVLAWDGGEDRSVLLEFLLERAERRWPDTGRAAVPQPLAARAVKEEP